MTRLADEEFLLFPRELAPRLYDFMASLCRRSGFEPHVRGESFHSGLYVPHYDSPRPTDIMEPGMTFTIEPMITLGTYEYDMWDDGWTVVTKDRSWTAQFEHTLVVTDDGFEILTLP